MGHKKGRYSEHYTALQARQFIDPKVWETYTKFGFVRHPYDWITSIYYAKLNNLLHEDNSKPFSLYLRDLKPTTTIFNWFLDDDGKMLVDDVYRVEDMFDVMKNEFGLKPQRKNATVGKDILLTEEDKSLIHKHFPHEFEWYK